MAKVLAVDNVQLALAKSNPPQLIVEALGRVSTSGWTHPELNPYTYFVEPQDGILDFDFNAAPPAGLALTIIRPISATISFVLPTWIKGVRIHAATGEPVVALLDAQSQKLKADTFQNTASAAGGGWVSSGRRSDGGDYFPWLIASEQI